MTTVQTFFSMRVFQPMNFSQKSFSAMLYFARALSLMYDPEMYINYIFNVYVVLADKRK